MGRAWDIDDSRGQDPGTGRCSKELNKGVDGMHVEATRMTSLYLIWNVPCLLLWTTEGSNTAAEGEDGCLYTQSDEEEEDIELITCDKPSQLLELARDVVTSTVSDLAVVSSYLLYCIQQDISSFY